MGRVNEKNNPKNQKIKTNNSPRERHRTSLQRLFFRLGSDEVATWGKGYATELSLGQIKKLQESFKGASIVATAHPLNLASKRVLEKVGMELVESLVELLNRGLRDVYRLKEKR